jgi:hypothetical protein
MKRLLTFASILLVTSNAFAVCTGSGSYRYCSDENGNSYNVQRIGNSTYMNAHNTNTGSNWSQHSQTVGHTTYHNGTAADGNSWQTTTTTIGSTRYINGTDSRGSVVSHTCNQYGCF